LHVLGSSTTRLGARLFNQELDRVRAEDALVEAKRESLELCAMGESSWWGLDRENKSNFEKRKYSARE